MHLFSHLHCNIYGLSVRIRREHSFTAIRLWIAVKTKLMGQGANGLTRREMCVYLFAHAKYMSKKLLSEGGLEMLCQTVLRTWEDGMAKTERDNQEGSGLRLEQPHEFKYSLHGIIWLMNVECSFGGKIFWMLIRTWINVMQSCTCVEAIAWTCTMCPHILPLHLCFFLLWCNNNYSRETYFTVATALIPACLRPLFPLR